MSHQFVPLLEVSEHADNIRLMDLNLPGVDVERLQVDVTRLKRAMHWGNIAYLALGSDAGEHSTFTFGGITYNPDGTLSATRSKIATKAKVSERTNGDMGGTRSLGWRNTAIYFNTSALEEHEGTEEQKVRLLDRSFRRSIFGDISEHDLNSRKAFMEVLVGLGMITYYEALERLGLTHDINQSFLEAFIFQCIPKPEWPMVTGIFGKFTPFFDNPRGLKYQHSSMYAFKFDRALLASRHLSRRIVTLQKVSKKVN